MKRYTLRAGPLRVAVECDDADTIRTADALARKFVGQPLGDLLAWLRKYGTVESRCESAARLFE